MNSLVKVFSNFKEFYSEINGATLTGAIDVIVVEQPNGTYLCSPFHVRFGKLGVLRSRQKIVDIEVNGEPVDIHMKLGESGEAFFVEECAEDDLEQLPANMATSPLPTSEFAKYAETAIFTTTEEDAIIDLPKPRRNSIDFSKESEEVEKKFENQVSDFSHRRHTDTMERHNLTCAKKEYTTQKIRQEWAEHEEQILGPEGIAEDWNSESHASSSAVGDVAATAAAAPTATADQSKPPSGAVVAVDAETGAKVDETKSKKKRRKKSMMKKKATQRKGSSSSSVGSANSDQNDPETDTVSNTATTATSSSTEESPKSESAVQPQRVLQHITPAAAVTAAPPSPSSPVSSPLTPKDSPAMSRARDLDIHFFSDTELASAKSPEGSRPSTPIQSDSEFEMSHRGGLQLDKAELMSSSSASWKWGELPTQGDDTQVATTEDAKQAQRNSMLSNMFSFMKQSKRIRKTSQAEGVYLSDLDTDGMDPEVAALYFPPHAAPGGHKHIAKDQEKGVGAGAGSVEDDRESGNGTSLPHSPSSMDGLKSLDSDYDDGKPGDNKCLDFVAMSLCGGIENGTGPTDEEFERNLIEYTEVCQNPSIFASPLLVVRLNGKYYSWAAACPIVMTIITYQKPLTIDAIEQLMNKTPALGSDDAAAASAPGNDDGKAQQQPRGGYSSWWSWRRSGGAPADKTAQQQQQQLDGGKHSESGGSGNEKDADPAASDGAAPVPVPSSRSANGSAPATPGANESGEADLFNKSQDLSEDAHTGEMYRKSLRLTSEQIESLNLKHGMNEISFSVTTAYQGTSRCKCYLFRWKHSDKVVISDIDGTITKSDVLGHILPMVGRDWAQIGVAQLFSKIEENGYKLLYLSARAIGQSRATREYLRSIRQGDVKLPDGPLLLNPTSLISAFHREVIEKKPEQFKIACLSDIRDLFPEKNPFYAGYGNRINDVWAYRAVGIPIMRIFTINPKGELKHELTQTFQSSYTGQTVVVNELFPSIVSDDTDDDDADDRSDASRSPDEGITSDEELQFGVLE